MVYSHKNVIVGAAAMYISEKDSTSSTGWWPTETNGVANGPVGPALPDFTANVKAEKAFDAEAVKAPASRLWRSAGYTSEGIEVSYEPDYGEVTVDQALDSVKMFKQGMRVSVNTTLSEATLENLLVAWGQQNSTLADGGNELKISSGELGDDPVERGIAFVGPAPRGPITAGKVEKRERVYHLRRALQVESSAHSLSRSDATTFPVSFRCLPDSWSRASGEDYGKIIQRVVS